MIIDEIKKANIEALKNKDKNARNIYGIIMNKYLLASVEARTNNNEIGDPEMVKIITKTIKELDEEHANYLKANNSEQANNILAQKEAIQKYLPKMLTETEIAEIINSLPNKSVPVVMKHFKTNYNGQVDMKLVSIVLNKK